MVGGITLSGKCLEHKNKDLSSELYHLPKRQGELIHLYNPSDGEPTLGGFLELTGQLV